MNMLESKNCLWKVDRLDDVRTFYSENPRARCLPISSNRSERAPKKLKKLYKIVFLKYSNNKSDLFYMITINRIKQPKRLKNLEKT